MEPKIALITILTNNVPRLVSFYRDILGFSVKNDLDQYVEFENEGVRFAICAHSIMEKATCHPSYSAPRRGQSFELAFPLENPGDVDEAYKQILALGATPIQEPATMPWGQRTAFFADPDGNIHELFAEISDNSSGSI